MTAAYVMFYILIVVFTALSWNALRKLQKNYLIKNKERFAYFKTSILVSLIPLSYILFLISFSEVTFKGAGLNLAFREIKTTILGDFTFVLVGVFIGLFIGAIVKLVLLLKKEKSRNKEISSRSDKKEKDKQTIFYPRNDKENDWWLLHVSVRSTTDEIIYRGLMFLSLSILFPSLHILLIIAISSILYALSYFYLGRKEMLEKLVAGAFYAFISLALASIVPVLLYSVLINYIRGIYLEKK